jgi:alkaline phosphatase
LGGETPWSDHANAHYLIADHSELKHAYTDSASSATAMTCGVKTYNNAINVDSRGREVRPLARDLQEQGFAVGAVSSVPISHATPACAFANNVHRNDYQDITRDMLGRPSSFHPGGLPGLDVLLGAGWGEQRDADGGQGANFVPGNRYLASADREAISADHGGPFIVVTERRSRVSARNPMDRNPRRLGRSSCDRYRRSRPLSGARPA